MEHRFAGKEEERSEPIRILYVVNNVFKMIFLKDRLKITYYARANQRNLLRSRTYNKRGAIVCKMRRRLSGKVRVCGSGIQATICFQKTILTPEDLNYVLCLCCWTHCLFVYCLYRIFFNFQTKVDEYTNMVSIA